MLKKSDVDNAITILANSLDIEFQDNNLPVYLEIPYILAMAYAEDYRDKYTEILVKAYELWNEKGYYYEIED